MTDEQTEEDALAEAERILTKGPALELLARLQAAWRAS